MINGRFKSIGPGYQTKEEAVKYIKGLEKSIDTTNVVLYYEKYYGLWYAVILLY